MAPLQAAPRAIRFVLLCGTAKFPAADSTKWGGCLAREQQMRIASLLSASSVDPQHSRSSGRGSDRYLVLILVPINQL
jgi:hypothetical protein